MSTGAVQAEETRSRLNVKGPRGREREIEAVIDTGFNESHSLPPALIAALGLQWQSFDRGILADGSEVLFDIYDAKVVWTARAPRSCRRGGH